MNAISLNRAIISILKVSEDSGKIYQEIVEKQETKLTGKKNFNRIEPNP